MREGGEMIIKMLAKIGEVVIGGEVKDIKKLAKKYKITEAGQKAKEKLKKILAD